MGQLTLNLVAISIFLVTMTALLGPLVQISPVVPAIAIVTLLGLATVDQLSWQGTLGNLVIGGLSRLDPDQRQRVARHEAGHFLIAHLLEIPVTDYSLTAWEAWRKGFPGQGGVQFDITALESALATGQIPAQALNRYGIVWMAGIAAEQWLYGEAVGGQDDQQKFTQVWRQLGRSAAAVQTQQRWAILQARTLLETHADAYAALVEALDAGVAVADCQALLVSHGAVAGDRPMAV
ncbi:MAG: ATP-dependent Zn protease [Leptolyngbya sp.]|nr:ATP-dependent Zn protease [Leptolyngbya sp.]